MLSDLRVEAAYSGIKTSPLSLVFAAEMNGCQRPIYCPSLLFSGDAYFAQVFPTTCLVVHAIFEIQRKIYGTSLYKTCRKNRCI
jgi:hypothetical protein